MKKSNKIIVAVSADRNRRAAMVARIAVNLGFARTPATPVKSSGNRLTTLIWRMAILSWPKHTTFGKARLLPSASTNWPQRDWQL